MQRHRGVSAAQIIFMKDALICTQGKPLLRKFALHPCNACASKVQVFGSLSVFQYIIIKSSDFFFLSSTPTRKQEQPNKLHQLNNVTLLTFMGICDISNEII